MMAQMLIVQSAYIGLLMYAAGTSLNGALDAKLYFYLHRSQNQIANKAEVSDSRDDADSTVSPARPRAARW